MARYKNKEIDKALNKEIGQRIKNIRLENGLTQTEFGNILKISRVAVYQLESGGNYPGPQTIELICNNFNINETWLRFGDNFDKFKKEDISVLTSLSDLSDEDYKFINEIFSIYKTLDADGQACLRKLAENMAENVKNKDSR